MPDQATTAEPLIQWVRDARARTCDLVADLSDEQMIGPKLPTINPLLWEIGHAAWFHEKWILRHVAGFAPMRPEADSLYDSIAIDHDIRWDLALLSRDEMMQYLDAVRDRVVDVLSERTLTDRLIYFVKLSVFHEDMHTEAFTYTRQTLEYPPPRFSDGRTESCLSEETADDLQIGECDVEIPGGTISLGSPPHEPFVFDNEKWAHSVEVQPFAISRTAVTQGQFAGFVEDRGYGRRELWCDEGWQWREQAEAAHPIHWRPKTNGRWLRRDFDCWVALEANRAMLHVNWFEAQAYCRWANRRLPTEIEWEAAATAASNDGHLHEIKRRYPWGDDPPIAGRANLDWRGMGAADVACHAEGDGAFGCRQMIGNVWEWTDTTFKPYPGFAVDPYEEYSTTSFDECKVLRGGCWTTRSRLIRAAYRNYYRPDRRDVWAGFRTCAAADHQ
ncbi:MAG: selenoneine synthase SenA [Pirellulales bacterium]